MNLMKITTTLPIVVAGLAILFAGCNRQDMRDQSRYEPLEPSAFFKDGQASRPLIENTVARGHLRVDTHMFEGKIDGKVADTLPMPMTQAVLDRGHQRYDIYCAPCHDAVGTGQGIVVQRGFPRPRSYHDAEMKDKPLGYYFEVISKGFGRMPDYAAQIKPADRWAIAAYIRALQLSQSAKFDDLPVADQELVKDGSTVAHDMSGHDDHTAAEEHH